MAITSFNGPNIAARHESGKEFGCVFHACQHSKLVSLFALGDNSGVQRLYPLVLTVLIAAWLQGCGTSQWEKGGVTRLPGQSARVGQPVAVQQRAHAHVVSRPDDDLPPAGQMQTMQLLPGEVTEFRTNRIGAQTGSVPAVPGKWLPVDQWASSQGIGNLRRQSTNQYQLKTYSGTFSLAERSRYALWNNRRFYLGYPLQQRNGYPYISALDAEKNLLPLIASHQKVPRVRGIICIDAGHGGKHTGTKSALGEYYEKDYTLDWAVRLKTLLEQRRWSVVLTRVSDQTVSLDERVHIADQNRADLFVSLHFNASNPSAKGLETYCTTPVGMPSTLIRGYSDPMGSTLPNNVFDFQNMHLAARVHDSLLRYAGMEDRGIRRARFMSVIVNQNRPAILIEGGYLSDPTEARLIASAQYRQRLAEAVAVALE